MIESEKSPRFKWFFCVVQSRALYLYVQVEYGVRGRIGISLAFCFYLILRDIIGTNCRVMKMDRRCLSRPFVTDMQSKFRDVSGGLLPPPLSLKGQIRWVHNNICRGFCLSGQLGAKPDLCSLCRNDSFLVRSTEYICRCEEIVVSPGRTNGIASLSFSKECRDY